MVARPMVTLVSVALLVALVMVLVVLVCRVGRHGSPPVPEDGDRIFTDQNHIPPRGIPMPSEGRASLRGGRTSGRPGGPVFYRSPSIFFISVISADCEATIDFAIARAGP
ncbi:hypothetical protein GCM10010524_48340 [Streptomyces mexicanus]